MHREGRHGDNLINRAGFLQRERGSAEGGRVLALGDPDE